MASPLYVKETEWILAKLGAEPPVEKEEWLLLRSRGDRPKAKDRNEINRPV